MDLLCPTLSCRACRESEKQALSTTINHLVSTHKSLSLPHVSSLFLSAQWNLFARTPGLELSHEPGPAEHHMPGSCYSSEPPHLPTPDQHFTQSQESRSRPKAKSRLLPVPTIADINTQTRCCINSGRPDHFFCLCYWTILSWQHYHVCLILPGHLSAVLPSLKAPDAFWLSTPVLSLTWSILNGQRCWTSCR